MAVCLRSAYEAIDRLRPHYAKIDTDLRKLLQEQRLDSLGLILNAKTLLSTVAEF